MKLVITLLITLTQSAHAMHTSLGNSCYRTNEVYIREADSQTPLIKHCLRVVNEAVNGDGDGFMTERHFSLWSCVQSLDEIRTCLVDNSDLWNAVRIWSEQLKFEIPRISLIQASIMPEIQNSIDEIQKLISEIESCNGKLNSRRGRGGRAWGV